MPADYELKPNKKAFVTYQFIIGFIFSSIFLAILYFVINMFIQISVLYFAAAFVLLELLSYYSLSIRYSKEKYLFFRDNIVHKSGGIFSDSETELIIRNITHVTMRLPFVENKLFQTGNIRIESAGSGNAEIYLSSIPHPKQVYEYIEGVMKSNGFKLSKSKLIQQEQPSIIGVIFEVFGTFVGTLFAVAFIIIIETGLINLIINNSFATLLISGIIIFLLFATSMLQFLDLKNRIYNLYSDTITYSEGFLSKNYSFIPIENLSDSTMTQTLVDKIFGLYDVKISCQGSEQEIHFKNMINGPEMKSNIEELVNKTKSLVGTEKQQGRQQTAKKVGAQKQTTYKTTPLQADTGFTAEYRMEGKRTIVPLLIALPVCLIISFLMIFWVIIFIQQIIKLIATRYIVNPKSMEEQYNFISSKNKEFTNDKITGIVFKENFIDKWFNTCAIHFWSIGSSESIKFTNIKKSSKLYTSILAKSGIKSQNTLYEMDSKFKVADMLKSTLPMTVISILLIFGFALAGFLINPLFIAFPIFIVAVYTAVIIYKTIYYRKSKLTFFKDFVYFTRGIFFKEFYYALYNNIKDITTVKYPFSKFGSIKFNVAGEQIVQQGKSATIDSNHFEINYIADIDNKDELIDLIFYQRPSAEKILRIEQNIRDCAPEQILLSKPDLANSLFGAVLISVVIFP
ncbi:MAG: PH domain-containing protein, partial [Candidatus Aenigmarchaeota archaeon]|nr:PH domain-containing protein [Candidatus Aenigmarchaeota archaeon]